MNSTPPLNGASSNQQTTSIKKSIDVTAASLHKDDNAAPPQYSMVALDLDGTLLSNNRQIAKIQADYLKTLHNRGFTVCIATGRAAAGVYPHLQTLGIQEDPLPVVCSNGARGFHCSFGKFGMKTEELFYNPVPKSVVERVIQLCKANAYAIQYYHGDFIYSNAQTPALEILTSLYMQYTGVTIDYVNDHFQSLLDQDNLPSKLLVLYPDEYSEAAMDLFSQQLEADATVIKGYCTWFLEILSPQVTKGHGLENMCSVLNIPLAEVIAIGDGCNDIEFLQMAGLGVAVQNAERVAKDAADWTVEWTNDEHGVMQALQWLQRKGQLKFE
jgi:hypothetical protein